MKWEETTLVSLVCLFVCSFGCLFGWLFGQTAHAQEVLITNLDTEQYPNVTLTYRAQDDNTVNIANMPPIITENGADVFDAEFTYPIDTGIEYTFVIDTNGTMGNVDEGGDGGNRLETVRLTIIEYLRQRQYMRRDGTDMVSVIVPNEADREQFDVLIDRSTGPFSQISVVEAYDPVASTLPFSVNIDGMLLNAFERNAETADQGRYQVVILFSNAEFLLNQLNYEELLAAAAESNVQFYGYIMGARADELDISNLAQLYDVTGGGYGHLPDAAAFEAVAEEVTDKRNQAQVTYSSSANSTDVEVLVQVGEAAGGTGYGIDITAPTVEILTTSEPLLRVGEDGAPFTDLEPRMTTVEAQVSWQDRNVYALESVTFRVDGEIQQLPEGALFDADGILTVDWDISGLTAGNHELQLEVVDQFGLTGVAESAVVPIAFDIARPTPTSTPLPTATPLPNPVTAARDSASDQISSLAVQAEPYIDQIRPYLTQRNITIGVGGLGFMFLLGLLSRQSGRRANKRRARPGREVVRNSDENQTVLDQPTALPLSPLPDDSTQGYLRERPSPACLEQFTPDTGDIVRRFSLSEAVHVIGSDSLSADIIIEDPSISRLHASIRWQHNRHTLYDEGSAYGTRLNMEQLGLSPRYLKDGDEISFGNTYIRFKAGRCEDVVRERSMQMTEATRPLPTPNILYRDETRPQPKRLETAYSTVVNPPPSANTLYKAVILDLDGTLIDTENASSVAWKGVGLRVGREFTEAQMPLVHGMRVENAIENMIAYWQLSYSYEDIRQMLNREWHLAQSMIDTMPGARELLQELSWRQLPTGVATVSHREYAEEKLRRYSFTVDAIAAGDEVNHDKPAADLYLLCADRLGIAPRECVAIEDTVLGHLAAAKAGMRVIAVPNKFHQPDEFVAADYILPDLHTVRRQLDQLLGAYETL